MNKLLNIYEGFFGNIRADLRSEFVFKFIDNMTNKYANQLLSIIEDKVDEVNNTYCPGFFSIANRCISKIKYNNKDKFDGYMKSINSYNIQPDSIRTIGDIVIVNNSRMPWVTSQIIITPETIGCDNSTLPDWVTLKSSFNNLVQQKTPCDVYIFGFKNLKNIDNIFDGIDESLNIGSLFIFDCPELDKVNINLKQHKCDLIFFDPDKDKKFTYMEMKRMFKFNRVKNLVFKHKNSEYKSNEESSPVKTNPTTIKIKNQSSKPSSPETPNLNNAAAAPGDIKDLPVLVTNNSYNVFTVDNMSNPVGRITRNGQKIYKINQANIWLTVQEIDGRKICFNKRGIPLYELKQNYSEKKNKSEKSSDFLGLFYYICKYLKNHKYG